MRKIGVVLVLEQKGTHWDAPIPISKLAWVLTSLPQSSPTDAAGEISAAEALRQACRNLQEVCAHVKTSFETAVAEKRQETAVIPMET